MDTEKQSDTWRAPLEGALKEGLRVLRLELADEHALLALEDSIQATIMSKAKAQALVTQQPQFEYFTMAGLWPRADGGWTILLRRSPINVQMRPMQLAGGRQ